MQIVEGNVTRFERLGLEDGLSQGCVNCILQDSQGFLWVGTQDGLNRYDGYTFTVYRHDPTDSTSLNANVTYALLEDSQGSLWLGTGRGLVRFDRRSEVFTPYPLGQKDGPQLGPVWIRAMLEDSQDMLWIGTYGQGLYQLDRRTGRWMAYQHDPEDKQSLPSDNVVALLEDAHGTLWIGTHGGGLGRFDRETGQFAHYRHRRDDPHSLGANSVNALCEDAQGNLWIGTQTAGLSALDLAAREPQFVRCQHEDGNPHSLSNNHVSALLEDTAGTLWVGTGRGLNELDRQTGRFRRHYSQESDPSSLSFDEVLSLAEDAQGLLWIGTRLGLNKFDRSTRAFGHFRRGRGAQSTLSSNTVISFLEDSQGFLWIGTYGGGLNRSTTDGTLTGFVHFGHREGDPHSLADKQALPDADHPYRAGENAVLALCEDAQGGLWIGTNAGLHRLLPGDHPGLPPTFARYQHEADNPTSLSDNTVLALALDAKGNLWIATPGGLNKLNEADATQGFVRYLHDENDPYNLGHDRVKTIHIDSAGNVWIGTNGGLNRVAPEDDSRYICYQHDDQDSRSLSHDWVTSIAEDAQGRLWLGTWGGLNRFDPQTGLFTAYREKDGLSNDVVYGVLVDDQGYLWLSTNRGINRFDPTMERFTHHDTHDGVQANEFADGAFYKDRLGRLYFGGINGFNVFHPDDIKANAYLPPVVLTSFLLTNQPVPISESGPLKEHINFAEQIELAPEDYVFAFEFSALNYRQPHKNRFAYQLEGFDRDWIYTDARDRKAVYTNVPPGTYTFRVKAANDDGLWNEEGASIQIKVSQPWWHIVFRSAFEAVVIHDRGTILQVNQAALELYGYEQAELIGQSLYMLIAPEVHDEVAEHIAMGDETPYESKGVRKDGSVFVSEVRARGIPYQGRLVRVTAIRDITERKYAEKALRQSREFLQAALDSLSAHIAILDNDGTIVAVNASWRRFAEENGLAWGDYGVGRNYLRAIEGGSGGEVDSGPQAARGIREVMAGQRPQFWLQYPCHSPGEERWFEMRVTRFEGLQAAHVAVSHENITERREAEARLRTLSRAVEQSDSTILVTDLEGTIEFVNPAFSRITGYTAPEAVGQNPRILKSGQMSPVVYTELWQTITRGRVWEGELLNKRKDGQYYWESAIISPVRDGSGTTTHYVAVKQDITARKQAEQALEQRVRHEAALAACSQALLKASGPQPLNRALLKEALAYLLKAVQASRAHVYRNYHDPDEGFCSGIVAEAVAPGLPSDLDNPFYQKLPWSLAPEQNRLALEAGQACGGPTVELFASTPELLETLLGQSILSVQFFPIHFGDEWWGYVGFDDCQTAREWDPEEILVLRTASQMIGSALQRWQAEAALQQAHDELDQQVQARTAELHAAVERLRQEVGQRERAEAETRERLVLQQSLAAISARLMQAADFDQAVVDVLAQTGALFDADRVFLVRLQSDGQTVHRIHEWCGSGVPPLFHSAEGWTLSALSGWLEELRERGRFYVEDTSRMPQELWESVPLFGGDASGGHCAVPVYARHEMVGFLGCHGLAPAGRDLEQHLQVLEVIVGILGSAWLRERVLETLDERVAARTRELSTFFDLTTLAIGAQDLSEMLGAIPGRILELGTCDAICIHLLDEEKTTLTLAAQGNLLPGMRQRVQAIALESDFLQRLEQLGDPLMITENVHRTPLPHHLRLEGFPSYLGVPLPGGWVSYYRTSPQGFSLDESSLLLALAEQVGVSVENHRLRRRIEAAATLEERGRLARDLHDSVTQSLYSLSLFARSGRDALEDGDTDRLASSLARLEGTALQSLREMRLLLYELRPAMLEQEGLIRTLEQRFDAVERRAGMRATLAYEGDTGLELPHVVERELYYLTIEALNNTLKHAQATEVTVQVWLSAFQVRLEIADDGRGFDPLQVSGGYGLGDMRERVDRLGGRLEISSAPGVGTRIQVWADLTEM